MHHLVLMMKHPIESGRSQEFKMKFVGFFLCLLLIETTKVSATGLLLRHLTPRPGGIIDTLTKPKTPGDGFNLGSHLGGGLSFGIGSFGFNFGFNKHKQYGPGGVNIPPKEPHVPGGIPGGNPYDPGLKPGYPGENPYVPGVKPGYPDESPYVPGVKPGFPGESPYIPGAKPDKTPVHGLKPESTWDGEKEERYPKYPRPNSGKNEKDGSKHDLYEDEGDYSKHETNYPKREDKDMRPDWEDIGEYVPENDSKVENFMDSDLVADGLIQPRLNRKRSKRSIESHVYHVPLIFRSNAKPYQVRVQSNLDKSLKESLNL